MTHDENLDAVRRAAIAANPEIAELKFGCNVMLPIGIEATCLGECDGDTFFAIFENGRPVFYTEEHARPFEVIGREITLPDVLLALGKVRGDAGIYVSDLGIISFRYREEKFDYHKPICKWSLRLPLSGQSAETVAHLAGLLASEPNKNEWH